MRKNALLSPSLVSSLGRLAPLACLVAPLATAACGGAPTETAAAEESAAEAPEAMAIRCRQSSAAPSIANVYTVVKSGTAWVPGTPEVGDAQELEIDWSIPTAPVNPFLVRVAIPGLNVDTMVGNSANPITPGAAMKLLVPLNIPTDSTRPIPLDGMIPFTVTLDPTQLAGLPAACALSSSYAPTMPVTALEGYQTQNRIAGVQAIATITPPATGATGILFAGNPLSTNHQQVLSTLVNSWSVYTATSPTSRGRVVASGAFPLVGSGYLPSFYAEDLSPWLTGATSVHAEVEVEVALSRVRVNRTMLDAVTWSELAWAAQGTPSMAPDLGTDAINEPTDPSIVAWVNATLGANYTLNMPPYEAAAKIFVATANAITYKEGNAAAPNPTTAVQALAWGRGDCGAYAILLTTGLRAIGVPARVLYGHWPTGGGTHAITEFWMPEAGWIPADATSSSTLFPKSGYPYFFGNVPGLDIWVNVSTGNQYKGDGLDMTWLEGAGLGNSNVKPAWGVMTLANDPAP